MKKFLMTGILVCLLYFTGAGNVFGSNNTTNYKKPAVLFIGGYIGNPYYTVARSLYKDGFNVGITDDRSVTWNKIKNYNVIVLTNSGTFTAFGNSNSDFTLTQTNRKNISVFMKFLSHGGGILYNPYYCEMKDQIPPQEAFGKLIGLRLLFRDVIFDKNNKIATAWRIPFGYTKTITLSPITKNINALWYPTSPNLTTFIGSFIPDDNWNVVVKGSNSSYTQRYSIITGKQTGKGFYSTAVPLAAYRKFGKGRIVLISIASDYLFTQSAATTLENIVLNKGIQGKPSDGYQLIQNSLKWLSSPSMKENVLGGAEMDMALMNNPFKVQFATPYNWSPVQTFPSSAHSYKGIIGAQAKYIRGKWNVKDWVEAGKKAGLSYIVFLEDFKNLTKKNLEQLKKECKKYTTNDFAVIPGFSIEDEIGDHYFFCGNNTLYPSKKFLSSDGKEFISYDPTVVGNPYQKGQLAMTLLDYAYTEAGFNETSGDYLYSKGIAPFTDFFSDWDAMGVITSINNREVENRTNGYLSVVQSGQGPTPVAIDIIDNPGQLSKVKWFTVLNGNNIQFVNQYWDRWHFYPSDPTNIYITDGPKIENWCFIGPRDYDWANKNNYVWQNYQWKVYGKVKSDVGLKEITIYNGTKLFRRFLPAGKKEFSFTLDLTHDKQYTLVMLVKDVNGKEAISEDQWAGNWRLEEFMCSDRNNQFVAGWLIRKDGTYIHTGGPTATPDKRTGDDELAPSGTFFSDARLGAPAFDGSPGGDPDFFSPVICNSVKGQTKDIKVLLIGIPRKTPLTKELYPAAETVRKFYQEFGLTKNGKPGYTVDITNGKIISQRYLMEVNGKSNKCFSGSISGNLISTLPIAVSNLNNRDSVYLYDRGLKEARPIGVFNHKAYSVITLHGTRNLFIGAPVICDNPDLFIQVTQTGKDTWHLGINNPTNRVINAHIILNPYFDPFKGKIIKESITINPGKSISRTI